MKNLLLVEHEWQVRDFLNRDIKGHWIAVGPAAVYALRKWGIAYDIPDAFHGQDELERICLQSREKLTRLCHELDDYAFSEYPVLCEWEIRPFAFNMFSLVILFDGLISRIFRIQKLAKSFPGYKIWAHNCPSLPPGVLGLDLLYSNAETLWGKVLALPGWDIKTQVIEAKHDNSSHRQKQTAGDQLERLLGRRLMSAGLYALNHLHMWREAASWKWSSRNGVSTFKQRGSLLVNASAGQWAQCFDHLCAEGWILFQGKERLFKVDCQIEKKTENRGAFLGFLREVAETKHCFKFLNISIFQLVQKHFTRILESALPVSQNIFSKLEAMIRDYKIKAIITANHPTFTSHAVNQIGRHLGLPVIKWQHGFVMIYDNMAVSQLNDINDALTSDVVLTFGKEVEKGYRHSCGTTKAEFKSVGSSTLDKIRESNHANQLVARSEAVTQILYVVTNHNENNWYCGFSPPFSVMNYCHDQHAILGYLARQADTGNAHVSIKLCPAPGFSDPPWVQEYSQRNNFRIVWNDPTFVALMFECDLVIIDSPTTTALEAIATRKPVFLLMSHVSYSSQARRMIEKRAVCVDNVSTLTQKLDDYIATRNYPADFSNNEYLKAYGNFLDDGMSHERAVRLVEKHTCNKISEKVEIREKLESTLS